MYCTKCSSKIEPIVAVDIDGTLADYHGDFLQFAGRYLDIDFGTDYVGDREMHEYMGISLTLYREVKLAYRQGGGKRLMPLVPGATDLMTTLRCMGAEIWLTTTRPYNKFDNTNPDTQFWLRRHGLPYDHLLYHEDKYAKLAEAVDKRRVVLVVDDLKEQTESADALFGGGVAFQLHTQYNRGQRAWGGSLGQASIVATNRIRYWRITNG